MRTGRSGILTNQRGTSLLEQMVALALTSVVVVAVASVWHASQEAYMDGAEAADLQQDLRIAMERLTRAIQTAGANPTNQTYGGAVSNDPAFVAFRDAGPQCLRLYADLDGDGRVTGPDENLTFIVSGTGAAPLIEAGGAGPDAGQPWVGPSSDAQTLASNIVPNPGGVPMFQFFTGPNDAAPNTLLPAGVGCGMADPDRSRIARIVIRLTVRGSVGNRTFTRTVVSEARPRNVP